MKTQLLARYHSIWLWGVVVLALAGLAAEARAGCCRVVRVDPQTPTGTVRVCEPDADGGCGTVLFEGGLALGDTQSVCAASPTLVYQELDPAAGTYGPPTQAVCDGTDVEL